MKVCTNFAIESSRASFNRVFLRVCYVWARIRSCLHFCLIVRIGEGRILHCLTPSMDLQRSDRNALKSSGSSHEKESCRGEHWIRARQCCDRFICNIISILVWHVSSFRSLTELKYWNEAWSSRWEQLCRMCFHTNLHFYLFNPRISERNAWKFQNAARSSSWKRKFCRMFLCNLISFWSDTRSPLATKLKRNFWVRYGLCARSRHFA